MKEVFPDLLAAEGSYHGQGTNHEGEKFHAEFALRPLLDGAGHEIEFRAVGMQGQLYHAEKTWLSRGPIQDLGLWTVNSNTPCVSAFALRRESPLVPRGFHRIFGLGDPADRSIFRQEIHLETLYENDVWRIRYHFHWGLPGGEFAYRSGVTLLAL